MKIKEVAVALERFAPLPLQEGYDNAGLQLGLTETEASGALLCLDVTEEVVREASALGCNVIVAHHPLLFRGLKCIADTTQVERCVREAILRGITIYAAHTNLDNAHGGVSFRMGRELGLTHMEFLQPGPGEGGSGVIGRLPAAMQPADFLQLAMRTFGVECLRHNDGPARPVQTVALCGGAGEFLIDEAARRGADAYLTGEIGYHRFFGYEDRLWLAALGHYESERFTIQLLRDVLADALPALPLHLTSVATNPIRCTMRA